MDFVKIRIPITYWNSLISHELLDPVRMVNTKTGVLDNKIEIKYNDLKFIFYDDAPNRKSRYIELQGSLHKYYNQGNHNANDFGLIELLWVILDIQKKLGLPIDILSLSNMEIGVNIEPPLKTNIVLNDLLLHKCSKFKDCYVKGGNYKQVAHTQYYLKCYNKGKQYFGKYDLPKNQNMRIELKFVKMQVLNNIGLHTLSDVFQLAQHGRLETLLTLAWSNVILFDRSIDAGALSDYQKEVKYHQWNNPEYWLSLTKQRRREQRRQYDKLVQNHSLNIHSEIGELIQKKWGLLINNSLPNYQESKT